jgi:hypothetical protein
MNLRMARLNLMVWLTSLIPTHRELRAAWLTGAVVYLTMVALSPVLADLVR